MTVTRTPAPARTDVRHTAASPAPPAPSTSTVRRLGLALAAGASTWAATMFAFDGNDGARIGDLGGLAFQLGVFALLAVMLRTRATGTSRASVWMLKVECVLLGLASVWSLLHAVLPDPYQDAVWLAVLDVFWPLSMLGMFVIAIKLAFAGRWTGLLRGWPLVAESWAVVCVPASVIFGAAAWWVGPAHLLVGYVLLGVLLAATPERTGAR